MTKRIFDTCISLFALVLLSPLFALLSCLVYFNIGSPIFFRQKRAGYQGRVFYIYKFRSMSDEMDDRGNLLPDHLRLSSFGQFLRSTSLDELPGLINVVKGEMSLVGPRPLLVEYLPLYNAKQATRHDVRPGITGWAQVNGRNNITWQQKFELDVWYVDNQSFTLDLKIIALTVLKVVRRQDISAEDHVTVERFKGNDER